ncbi:MotA/TolQ/ExbB proton channel family protein [bacterium]|nr:MotA/TolQ/ExbB proton channel family protein [bacterium]
MKNFFDMFMTSSLLSKSIMMILVLMSAYCWSILYIKWRKFRKIRITNKKIRSIVEGRKITDILNLSLKPDDNPLVRLIETVKYESPLEQFTDSQGKKLIRRVFPDAAIFRDRLDAEIDVILAHEERNIDFLAATASIAPFLGLLGTVLGITSSFWEIGQQSTANIAVVAPGLAEALITTIVGLLVAIPAALSYHWLRSQMKDLVSELEYFSKNLIVKITKNR